MKREYLARVIASLLITHTLTLRPPIAALGDVEECVGMDQKRAQIFLSAMGFPTLDVRSAHKDMRNLNAFAVCCLGCSHQCACLIGYVKAIYCCQFCFCGVIMTLGLYGPWRESLGYWWGFLKPVFFLSLIQVWVSFIAPAIITCVYGLVLWIQSCGSFDLVSQTGKGLMMAFASQAAAGQPAAVAQVEEGGAAAVVGGLVIEASDIEKLVCLNAPHWKEDFDYSQTQYSSLESTQDKEAAAHEAQVDLEDAKIAIFAATLFKLASIVLEQAVVIYIIRALKATSFEGFVSSIYLTLSERTANNYFHYLSTVGELAHQTALDVVWMLL